MRTLRSMMRPMVVALAVARLCTGVVSGQSVPFSFSFTYTFAPPGRQERFWSTQGDGTWIERAEGDSGFNEFRVVGRTTVEACPGTLVQSTNRDGYQVFIPDLGCTSAWLRQRVKDAPWSFLA